MMKFLKILDRILVAVLRGIALTCFVGLLVLLAATVFVRFVPISSLGWTDEIIEWAFAWMVFMGAAVLWRDNEHFRVTCLECYLYGKKSGRIVDALVKAFSLFFLVIMTYYGLELTIRAHDRSPILELPRHFWYACIPISGMIMIIYSIRTVVQDVRGMRQREKEEELSATSPE